MTWEEAVKSIRSDSSLNTLVVDAYLSEDLLQNVDRFRTSIEFTETQSLIKQNITSDFTKVSLLDIGAGNGIASLAFALLGINVTAVEPDPSFSVGNGAIQKLKDYYNLTNLTIIEQYMEDLDLPENTFDVVYGRQVMHHAYDLERFAKNCYRLVRPGGILMTVRDHMVKHEQEKEVFLQNHPLHNLYGGENAFTLLEYKKALLDSGFTLKHIWSASQSPLNFSPWSDTRIKEFLAIKLGILANLFPLPLARLLLHSHLERIPGRLYSFLCTK